MNTGEISRSLAMKVGLFTVGALVLIGTMSIYVNDRPFWWRKCELIHVHVEDATGLKTKSPVRSLGLQIGFLKSIALSETHVSLGICITAPVKVLSETKAYIRGEGFLGDKFIELKPVHYVGSSFFNSDEDNEDGSTPVPPASISPPSTDPTQAPKKEGFWKFPSLMEEAYAEEQQTKQVPVAKSNGDMDRLIENANQLVQEMTVLTKNLREGMDPGQLRDTMKNLNKTLENASKMLAPEGGVNATARRALEKLEDAFEQMRQQMTRINKGEGGIGRILNDPAYADELIKALKNVNRLLNKTADLQIKVNVGGDQLPAYDGGRGFFQVSIWPSASRYYLLGVSIDPRGRFRATQTTTTAGGTSTVVKTETLDTGIFTITGMLGKVLWNRLDLSLGALHGDGALSSAIYLGPSGNEDVFQFRTDGYARGKGQGMNARLSLIAKPFYFEPLLSAIQIRGGLEGVRKVNGQVNYYFGAGISFTDEEIKLLFTFL